MNVIKRFRIFMKSIHSKISKRQENFNKTSLWSKAYFYKETSFNLYERDKHQ